MKWAKIKCVLLVSIKISIIPLLMKLMARLDAGLCSNDVSGLVSPWHLLSSHYASGFTSQKHCEVTSTTPLQARKQQLREGRTVVRGPRAGECAPLWVCLSEQRGEPRMHTAVRAEPVALIICARACEVLHGSSSWGRKGPRCFIYNFNRVSVRTAGPSSREVPHEASGKRDHEDRWSLWIHARLLPYVLLHDPCKNRSA